MDKSGANLAALEEFNAERNKPIKIRQNKYLNNVIEVMHMIRKGQVQHDGDTRTAAEQFYSLVI